MPLDNIRGWMIGKKFRTVVEGTFNVSGPHAATRRIDVPIGTEVTVVMASRLGDVGLSLTGSLPYKTRVPPAALEPVDPELAEFWEWFLEFHDWDYSTTEGMDLQYGTNPFGTYVRKLGASGITFEPNDYPYAIPRIWQDSPAIVNITCTLPDFMKELDDGST